MASLKIGKLFHLTPLVDDLAAAEAFFLPLFTPLVFYRGYAAHWHRNATLMTIADAVVEPLQPLAPEGGGAGTSWYRYMATYGPRIHNVALYASGLDDLGRRLDARGVRHTDAGVSTTLFVHPKDHPGMLEFSTADYFARTDPRMSPEWEAFAGPYWSGLSLGLERLSHITLVVEDRGAATDFYTEVLDGRVLPEQGGEAGAKSAFVVVGDGTVFELAEPDGPGFLADELERVGQSVTGATWKVRDVAAAAEAIEQRVAMRPSVGEGRAVLDPAATWGAQYAFTERALEGDPRV